MRTLLKTTATLITLALSVPAMAATDGSLGATSTGNFDVNMTINLPPAPQVRVFELEDFPIGIVEISNSQVTSVAPIDRSFCATNSTNQSVRLQVSQPGNPNSGFVLNGALEPVPANIFVLDANETGSSQFNNAGAFHDLSSSIGCSAATKNTNGYKLRVAVLPINSANDTARSGQYSGSFVITASVP